MLVLEFASSVGSVAIFVYGRGEEVVKEVRIK